MARLAMLGLLLIIAVGCALGVEEVAPEPASTPGVEVPSEVTTAREAVLDFLRKGANECVPPAGVTWQAAPGRSPEGFGVYLFNSGDCLMTVSYPLAPPDQTLYHVTIGSSVTGFCWQANVSERGRVVETGLASELIPDLANAAAAYCQEQGYRYEVIAQGGGSRCGMCIFPDGSSCNAWAYFQGRCEPGRTQNGDPEQSG